MYDGIPYQVKQGAGDQGITAEDMEKSQHTNFNKDMTNESASVACSNVWLWKMDNQTERALWDKRAEKDSVGFMHRKENKWVGS